MDIETLRSFVLEMPGITEGFPFGENTLVFKVGGKVFLLVSLDAQPLQFNVKCNPDRALELREEFPDTVLPGYHMNKKHWNTVLVNGTISGTQLRQMIADSYKLVTKQK